MDCGVDTQLSHFAGHKDDCGHQPKDQAAKSYGTILLSYRRSCTRMFRRIQLVEHLARCEMSQPS
jgi:hypothetical protein